jgi:hypothetical protein
MTQTGQNEASSEEASFPVFSSVVAIPCRDFRPHHWQFYLLYGSGYCCNMRCSNRGELMFWRIVISVAVVEALLCVLPIEFAGAVALIRLLLGQ